MQIQNLEKMQIYNPGAFGWRGPQDFPQGLALQAGQKFPRQTIINLSPCEKISCPLRKDSMYEKEQ